MVFKDYFSKGGTTDGLLTSTSDDGLMSAADKAKLDGPGSPPATITTPVAFIGDIAFLNSGWYRIVLKGGGGGLPQCGIGGTTRFEVGLLGLIFEAYGGAGTPWLPGANVGFNNVNNTLGGGSGGGGWIIIGSDVAPTPGVEGSAQLFKV
jgi:hypothetical protein